MGVGSLGRTCLLSLQQSNVRFCLILSFAMHLWPHFACFTLVLVLTVYFMYELGVDSHDPLFVDRNVMPLLVS
jgi:hypothetical protein